MKQRLFLNGVEITEAALSAGLDVVEGGIPVPSIYDLRPRSIPAIETWTLHLELVLSEPPRFTDDEAHCWAPGVSPESELHMLVDRVNRERLSAEIDEANRLRLLYSGHDFDDPYGCFCSMCLEGNDYGGY